MDPPPPPPPPHGANAQGGRPGGLPDGKYDIFVIPPSSAGSGFLYLPSLQTHRNSFLAGVACTAVAFFIWSIAVPAVKEWFNEVVNGGGVGVMMLVIGVGVGCWAWGKTQGESSFGGSGTGPSAGASARPGAGSGARPGSGPSAGSGGAGYSYPSGGMPKSSWQRPPPQANTTGGAKASWDRAREETRKKEEERRRMEELKKRREDAEKERQKQREKDARERIERELKEKREKAAAAERAKSSPPPKKPQPPPQPTARTEQEDDAYSFRPYDRAKPKAPQHKANSAASIYSEASSYLASQTTARTTPPPSNHGPYTTKDPDKIIIKAVYSFNNAFQRTPVSQLISGQGNITDGLILRITTEGLFIDDDVRGVPQREWDVKAWTLKLAESGEQHGLHILRASIRDQEGKKFVFVLSQTEGWKVAVGLQKLRRGTQVRALGVSGMPANETKALIDNLGWGSKIGL